MCVMVSPLLSIVSVMTSHATEMTSGPEAGLSVACLSTLPSKFEGMYEIKYFAGL